METRSAADTERGAYLKNVESSLERISGHDGVIGYFVIEPQSGRLLKYDGFDNSAREVGHYVDRLRGFIDLAASTIRTLDWRDSMTFLRLSFGPCDVLVAPDQNKQYTLVVVQEVDK